MAPQGTAVTATGGVGRLLGGPLAVGRALLNSLSLRTTALAGVVAFSALVCEGLHDATTPAVFSQTLGWSAEQYARTQGVWGTLGKMLGALLGGYLCDRFGRRLIAGSAASLSTATFVLFGLTAFWWSGDGYPLAVFIFVIQGTIAMTQVSLFSLFMKVSLGGGGSDPVHSLHDTSQYRLRAGALPHATESERCRELPVVWRSRVPTGSGTALATAGCDREEEASRDPARPRRDRHRVEGLDPYLVAGLQHSQRLCGALLTFIESREDQAPDALVQVESARETSLNRLVYSRLAI